MTIEEFDKKRWGFGVCAIYQGNEYPVSAVSFEGRLVGLTEVVANDPDSMVWVRCENITVTGGIDLPENVEVMGGESARERKQ